MKKLKHVKLFENFQSATTLRDLVGSVKSEISEYLLVTDKGILINGFGKDEFENELDNEITVENELVYLKDDNYEHLCLAIDDNGQIVAASSIPGDYMGYDFDGTMFKVHGHDGVETLNIATKKAEFIDRAELDEEVEGDDLWN